MSNRFLEAYKVARDRLNQAPIGPEVQAEADRLLDGLLTAHEADVTAEKEAKPSDRLYDPFAPLTEEEKDRLLRQEAAQLATFNGTFNRGHAEAIYAFLKGEGSPS